MPVAEIAAKTDKQIAVDATTTVVATSVVSVAMGTLGGATAVSLPLILAAATGGDYYLAAALIGGAMLTGCGAFMLRDVIERFKTSPTAVADDTATFELTNVRNLMAIAPVLSACIAGLFSAEAGLGTFALLQAAACFPGVRAGRALMKHAKLLRAEAQEQRAPGENAAA